jgi:hypothetical protein
MSSVIVGRTGYLHPTAQFEQLSDESRIFGGLFMHRGLFVKAGRENAAVYCAVS